MSDIDDDESSKQEVDESWMGTFSDLCLLLLTFFILLCSMSTIEVIKFKSVFGSMRETFGGIRTEDLESGATHDSMSKSEQEEQSIQQFLRVREELMEAQRRSYNEIRSFITTKGMEGEVSAVFDEGVITLTVPASVLFAQGEEELSPQAEPALRSLLHIFMEERDQNINIKGYTDNSPVPQGKRYKNNWELSALRAVNVLRWFVNEGVPIVRLTATGMGDLNPLFPNDTPENQARNRRVEFTLERQVRAK